MIFSNLNTLTFISTAFSQWVAMGVLFQSILAEQSNFLVGQEKGGGGKGLSTAEHHYSLGKPMTHAV